MFCTSCGNQIPDGQYVCNACGAYVGSSQQTQPQNLNNGYQPQNVIGDQPQNTYQNLQYQQNNMNQMSANYQPIQSKSAMGMKWFNFVIWVQLFLSALMYAKNGFTLIGDNPRGAYTNIIYNYYDGLQMLDFGYAMVCFFMVAFALLTRFALAGFKSYGPMMYYILIVCSIIIALIYFMLNCETFGVGMSEYLEEDPEWSRQFIINIITDLVMLVCNIIYFKKRKHLFNK